MGLSLKYKCSKLLLKSTAYQSNYHLYIEILQYQNDVVVLLSVCFHNNYYPAYLGFISE
jgi:hypothetical protein